MPGDALYPAWLLPQPLRLEVRGDKPHYHGPLRLLAGPQRLETGWWDDGAQGPALRDYFIARSDEAGLLWVYRERLPADDAGALAAPVRWFLQGCTPEGHRHPPSPAARLRRAALPVQFQLPARRFASQELVERAYELGYAAWRSPTNVGGGVVRAYAAWKRIEAGPASIAFQLILGSEFALRRFPAGGAGARREGWGNLCEFITARAARSGEGRVHRAAGTRATSRCWPTAKSCLCPQRSRALDATVRSHRLGQGQVRLAHLAGRRNCCCGLDDELWLDTLQQRERGHGVPLVAAGDVHMHVRSRKPLQDVITAVRAGQAVAECGLALQANAERHLRPRVRLGGIYPPELLANTLEVAARCSFSLESIKYQYPLETVPAGHDARAGAAAASPSRARARRYPQGVPWKVRRQLVHELRPDRRVRATRCTS